MGRFFAITSRLSILLVGVCLLSGCMNQVFYQPDRVNYQTPSQDGYVYEDVYFTSLDGTKLHGWYIPAKGSKALGTVIQFHGNAQNMSAHYSFVDWLPAAGFNLFLFDYRGYGQSEGEPDRQGVYDDSLAALNYISKRPDLDREKICVLGQSLGGANALAVLGSGLAPMVRGAVIDSAFYSYRDVAEAHASPLLYWLVPLVISEDLSPEERMANIPPIPLIFIHGTADRVIPYMQSIDLYDAAKDPKALWLIPYGAHTDALSTNEWKYRPKILQFFKDCVK